MQNKNFWKDKYKDSWELSNKKEALVAELITEKTGMEVLTIGFGARSSEYIQGTAEENGFKAGDADLYVKNADAYVEVTGSNVPMFATSSLWVRPDKIRNSAEKLKNGQGKLHLIFHVVELKNQNGKKLIRCINLNKEFFDRLNSGKFRKVAPVIRGSKEEFYEIFADDKCIVKDFTSLFIQG